MKKHHYVDEPIDYRIPQKTVCGRTDVSFGRRTYAFTEYVTCLSCKKNKDFQEHYDRDVRVGVCNDE